MAEITWTEEALRWLEDIFEYIALENPRAAAETVDEIYSRSQQLADYPEIDTQPLRGTSGSFSRAMTFNGRAKIISTAHP